MVCKVKFECYCSVCGVFVMFFEYKDVIFVIFYLFMFSFMFVIFLYVYDFLYIGDECF